MPHHAEALQHALRLEYQSNGKERALQLAKIAADSYRTELGIEMPKDLQKMAADHPIVEDLLRYREVEKLRNTYADALPPLVGPDGRIHSVLNQTVATTGRISADSPNLQNIPLRTPGGRELPTAQFLP